MFPIINKRETGVNLRRIMDMRAVTPKDVQGYLGLGCVQSVYRWFDVVNKPTIDNLNAISGNGEQSVSDNIIRQIDSRERRLHAYYEKLCENRVA